MLNYLRGIKNRISFDKKTIICLLLILVLGGVLRFAFLGNADLFGDEPFYPVRAQGWFDILLGSTQTTPMQWWMDSLPWWTKLSFHDHPPLFFAIEHIFIKFLGNSIAITRLPSAIFGTLSILLVFLVTKKLFNKRAALLAALFSALNIILVFYSRVSMMEAATLFFILLSFYFFILSLEKPKYLIWLGVAFGLSILTKYIAFVPAFLFFAVILIKKREYFKDYRLYLAIFVALLLFSPVLFYNYELYKTAGHFDLQFSFLLHQDTVEWGVPFGKTQRGDLSVRVEKYLDFFKMLSPVTGFLILSSLFFVLVRFWKIKFNTALVAFMALLYLFFLLYFGVEHRFIFYPIVFLLILAGVFMDTVFTVLIKNKIIFVAFLTVVVVFEFLFTANSIFAATYDKPILPLKYVTYSPKLIVPDLGIKNLTEYIEGELEGKYSLLKPQFLNPNLNQVLRDHKTDNEGLVAKKIALVNDNRSDPRVYTWLYTRLGIFEGWPFSSLLHFQLINFDESLIDQQKDTEIFFIASTPYTAQSFPYEPVGYVIVELETMGYKPYLILNKRSFATFLVYKLDMASFIRANISARKKLLEKGVADEQNQQDQAVINMSKE